MSKPRKFKTSDKIVRVDNHQGHAPLGFTTIVTKNYEYLGADGYEIKIVDDLWELVEDTSKHHVHHDLIIAWAKGAEIETVDFRPDWQEVNIPCWYPDEQYRIKPTPHKTDKERIAELEDRVTELEELTK